MTKLLNAFDELNEANQLVKSLCPDTWQQQMKIYRLMIEEQMKFQRNVIFAAIILANDYSEKDPTRMWIYATAVEMIPEG